MHWDGSAVLLPTGLSFIVCVAMNAMAIIKPISITLQSRQYDIFKELNHYIDKVVWNHPLW